MIINSQPPPDVARRAAIEFPKTTTKMRSDRQSQRGRRFFLFPRSDIAARKAYDGARKPVIEKKA